MPPVPMRSVMRYSPLSTSVPIRESVIRCSMVPEQAPAAYARIHPPLRGDCAAAPRAAGVIACGPMAARPFPYAALARFSAADATLLRGALRALMTPSARATAEAEALLGVRAALETGVVEL